MYAFQQFLMIMSRYWVVFEVKMVVLFQGCDSLFFGEKLNGRPFTLFGVDGIR
jgi:hypothetical protein